MLDQTGTIADKLRTLWHHLYTERQLYLRSHGQVQFVSLSPLAQLGLSAVALCFLSWVAFTSVNVVFKEQIIASKDRRYVKMQAGYEERVSQMQASYDELNGQLVIAQERFLATTRELEAKHGHITKIIVQKQAANELLLNMRERFAETREDMYAGPRSNTVLMAALDLNGAPRVSRRDTAALQNDTMSRIEQADESTFGLGLIFGRASASENDAADPIQARLSELDQSQQTFINTMEETTDRQIREMEALITMTGVLEPKTFVAQVASEGIGSGGPLISLADEETSLAGSSEEAAFGRQVYRISRNLDRMAGLNIALSHVPLGTPLHHERITSDFGRRVDPFTKKFAYHSGVDMGAPFRTPVYATAPGVVTHAGYRPAYGRLVEIDHGNGLRSRYAHLKSVHVKKGDKVDFRQLVGRVGSSGRSTGPHVHYEIWYKDKAQDPSKFIEAGRYVLTFQG